MTEPEDDDARMRRLMKDQYERPLLKRFYKSVTVSDDKAILLDGRVVKTPMKAMLRLPSYALARAIAEEWEAQAAHINPALMPLTRFSNTAIDRATAERSSVIEDFVKYAGNDLVCYRADRPPDLVALQRQHWDPVVAMSEAMLGCNVATTQAMVHVQQSPEMLAAARRTADALDQWQLTAVYNLTTLLGSAFTSLLLQKHKLKAEPAWLAANVEEDYQTSTWGWDEEAKKRRTYRRAEFDGLLLFLELVEGSG